MNFGTIVSQYSHAEGVFVTLFGSRGEHPGQFDCPHGIVVNNSGVMYVCDKNNHRVVAL